MQERKINIPIAEPIEFYGANNSNLKLIKNHFPKVKFIARGKVITLNGESKVLDIIEEKLNVIFAHLEQYHSIDNQFIEKVLTENHNNIKKQKFRDDVLVFGPSGIQVKARTANQARMVSECDKNDMLFAVGPAGTGKTYTAVALAVRALKDKKVKRIILTRPAVEAGENLGFLPGDLKEKLDPYMQPLYDALFDMIHYEKLAEYVDKGVIEIAPLAFMRGRTLDNAFVILDEAQNSTIPQIKMFLTRMGEKAKFIITGDATQVDLPRHQASGLLKATQILKDTEGISIIELDASDVIRHKLVKKVITAFEKDNKRTKDKEES